MIKKKIIKARNEQKMEADWWNVKEVAAYLGLRRGTIYNWCRQGLFPPGTKIGPGKGTVRWRRTAVKSWVTAKEQGQHVA